MRVHDVEGVVGKVERVDVGGAELDVGDALVLALGLGRLDRRGCGVDPDHLRRARPDAAKSSVIVPGPQPTSRSDVSGPRWGMRYAAELSTVRQRWERSTASW